MRRLLGYIEIRVEHLVGAQGQLSLRWSLHVKGDIEVVMSATAATFWPLLVLDVDGTLGKFQRIWVRIGRRLIPVVCDFLAALHQLLLWLDIHISHRLEVLDRFLRCHLIVIRSCLNATPCFDCVGVSRLHVITVAFTSQSRFCLEIGLLVLRIPRFGVLRLKSLVLLPVLKLLDQKIPRRVQALWLRHILFMPLKRSNRLV